MYDPVMRVLTVLEILQTRDRVTGAELVERLEVDLRTVQRYIVRLKDLGVPVDSTPGIGGAYRLRPGYRVPPLLLSNEEVFALSLGLKALDGIGLADFAPATDAVRAKLERVLPESLRESIRTVDEVIAIEPGSWIVPASVENLTRAATAVRTSRRIRFHYRSHTDAATQREMEPYAVLHLDDRWYLIGRDLRRKALRTFRLDRVTELQLCGATFVRPEAFDARQYLAERMPFLQSAFQIDVWIDLPIQEAQKNFALWRVAAEAEGEGTRLRCSRDQLEIFAAVLLSLGRRIVVHSPDALRETFRQLAASAMKAAAADASHDPRNADSETR